MMRAIAILIALAGCGGCASKTPAASGAPTQPSFMQRMFSSNPRPRPEKDASYNPGEQDDKRDKDNDF